jgi:hypothetical protein
VLDILHMSRYQKRGIVHQGCFDRLMIDSVSSPNRIQYRHWRCYFFDFSQLNLTVRFRKLQNGNNREIDFVGSKGIVEVKGKGRCGAFVS